MTRHLLWLFVALASAATGFADIKWSALPAASSVSDSDYTAIVQGGVNKRATFTLIRAITASQITDATTVGRAILSVTNPSAIRFLRVNADNSVTLLSASDFLTAIGGGAGVSDGDKGDITVSSSGAQWDIDANSIALGTDTTGSYAAGDAEAGAATSGDSATSFFSAGTIERARGGTAADTSAYGTGLLGSDGSNATIDVDTLAELETAIGSAGLATDAEVAAAYQPLDADLTDLADGTLTASKLDQTANFDWTGEHTFDADAVQIDDTNASHQLILTPGSNLTADRVLTITTGDSARTLTFTADATIGGTTSGTNTGDQTITLTGDVTGSGTSSFAATIADNSVDGTDIAVGSDAQGDVLYYDGTNWVRLGAGTNGQVLHTQGAGANPIWDSDDGAGGGAPSDADYLVGTANGSLSAEIVVGTSPGGELGNTWASPTLDDSVSVSSWNLTTPTITTSVDHGTAGVRISDDGDGALTFLGLGNGSDEDLTINLDDTSNTATVSSSTGLNSIVFSGIDLTIPTATVTTVTATTITGAGGGITLDASGFNGNLTTGDNTLQEVAQKLDDLTTSGAPTDADYLVGTANGSLSAEIVVGTSPGGELGGTWGSPTLDDSVTVTGWVMGASTATTPSADDNDTSLATTAYVQTELTAYASDTVTFTNKTLTSPALTTPATTGVATFGNGATGTGDVRILEDTDAGSNYASFTVPSLAANTVYLLPPDDGDSGEQLQTNGSGTLTWEAAGSGGATAWTDIGDATGDTQIYMGAHETDITADLDAAGEAIWTLVNGDDDTANDTSIIDLRHEDGADANVFYLRMVGDNDGTPTDDYLFSQAGFTSTLPVNVPSEAYDDSGWNSDTGAPQKDAIRDKIATLTAVDFLVGTATSELSAEIVVGTSPGGELGGTWAGPTLDDSVAVTSWTLTTPALITPTTGNGSTGPGYLDFLEDTDNGSNRVRLIGPTSTADVDVTLPAAADTLVGKATTDTFTNKTLDASATGNVLKFKALPQFTSPLRTDGTNATIGTTPGTLGYGLATFSNSVDEASNWVEFRIVCPADWDTAVDPTITIIDLIGADTGARQYVASVASVAASASATTSPGTAIDINMAADGSGASGDAEISSSTTLTGWGAAMTPGRLMIIRIARDGDQATQDASTVNSTLIAAELSYGATQ